jgi:acetoin utilization deacetylase AcuC-like enzyme
MGHKRIDETMLYVHVAEAHARELPDHIREAAQRETEPAGQRRRDARCPWQSRGLASVAENENSGISAA